MTIFGAFFIRCEFTQIHYEALQAFSLLTIGVKLPGNVLCKLTQTEYSLAG